MKKFLLILAILIPGFLFAQINDDFEDGNIDGWTESETGHWEASSTAPINGSLSLHHIFDNTAGNHEQISYPFGNIDLNAGIVTWQFQIKYGYNPSGGNNWGFFLMSDVDASEMYPQSGSSASGYVIGVNYNGESDDMVGLWEVSSGSESRIINTNSNWQDIVGTSQAVGFQVTRSTSGEWNLSWDTDGGFDNLVALGQPIINTNQTTANYCGLYYLYTSSADMKLWLDDVSLTGTAGNDDDSEVSAGSGTEPTTISSIADTQAEAITVFDFSLTDKASGDLKPTIIDQLKISKGTFNNITNWNNAITGAVLTGPDITGELEGTVNNDNITFSANDFISVADGTNETYSLKIWLKTDLSGISDNDSLDFKLQYSDITCDTNGSSFGSGSIESNVEKIDIEASKLIFSSIPSSVAVNTDFSLSVSGCDENNNTDTDFSGTVTLSKSTGSGTLSSLSGLAQTASEGIATWGDLRYNTIEDFTISASSGTFTITSNNIQCLNSIVYLDDDFEDADIAGWQELTASHWEASPEGPISGTYSLKQTYDNPNSDIDVLAFPLNSVNLNSGSKEWHFQIKYANNAPSGNNNWSVFLMSDNDQTEMSPSGNINGYILGVNFSGTDDLVKLSEVTAGVETPILTTNFDWNNTSTSQVVGFKVIRSTLGEWEVFIDENGGDDNYLSYGTATNNTHTIANYFGIYYKYSSTQDRKLWLDDIYFGDEIPDLDAPTVDTMEVTGKNTLKIVFNEDLNQTTAENTANYNVNNSIGQPSSATLNIDKKTVNVEFATDFVNNQENALTVTNIEDESGNIIAETTKNFTWVAQDAITASATTDTTLNILFSKEVDETTALTLTNYIVNNSIGNPESITIDTENNKLIHLEFATKFSQGQNYTINVSGVTDTYGNLMTSKDLDFIYYKPEPYDVVVNEIMCDVNPVPEAIPPYEYVELYNNSDYDITLTDWTFTLGSHTPKVFPATIIPANGYVIICDDINVADFAPYGTTVPILNPSDLTSGSSGNRIVIRNQDDEIISDMTYWNTWYNDTDKDDGGWSIERIDPTNLCGEEENWAATIDYTGGTPGRINSVYTSNPDNSKPEITKVEVVNSKHLKIYFSEKVNKALAETLTNYTINGTVNPNSAIIFYEDYSIVDLYFDNNFTIGNNTINIQNISDNCDNIMDTFNDSFSYELIYPKSVEVMSSNQLRLHFSEVVDKISGENELNYSVNNSIGTPEVALRSNEDSTIINLQFSNDFTLGEFYEITVNNIQDANNNIMTTKTLNFAYYTAQLNDIVINEIMADFNPAPTGLPATTYIELYNTSDYDLDLTNWIFQAEGQAERTFPYHTLKSHEYLILCQSEFESNFSQYGNVISFLTSSDVISSGRKFKLMLPDHTLITELEYTKDWYGDSDKDDGGWSLERIDPTNYCGETSNWVASVDNAGGTPGKINSVNAANPDNTSPELDTVIVISSNHLKVLFTEKVSKESGTNISNFSVDNSIGNPDTIIIDENNKSIVDLFFASQFVDKTAYTLMIENIYDNCTNQMTTTSDEFTYNLINVNEFWVKDDKRIKIKFSETVDKNSSALTTNYTADNDINNPESVVRDVSDTTTVHVQFAKSFPDGEEVKLTLSNIEDINGNSINDTTLVFTYYVPKVNDLAINEVLFNPQTGGKDFVEIYNRSNQKLDLINFQLATYDKINTDSIVSISALSEENKYINPGEYMAFSTDRNDILQRYMTSNANGVIEVTKMPTYSNDKGNVILLYADTLIIDQFAYNEDMHFALLDSKKGVSLERVNYNKTTQDETNWHSASEYVGFATPAYKNSQYQDENSQSDIGITVEPEIFSPDNDGTDDYAKINYKFDTSGNVASVYIFNSKGLLIRTIANNKLLSAEGLLIWDGLDENQGRVRPGIYIVYFKVFDLEGKISTYKKTVVCATKY